MDDYTSVDAMVLKPHIIKLPDIFDGPYMSNVKTVVPPSLPSYTEMLPTMFPIGQNSDKNAYTDRLLAEEAVSHALLMQAQEGK